MAIDEGLLIDFIINSVRRELPLMNGGENTIAVD